MKLFRRSRISRIRFGGALFVTGALWSVGSISIAAGPAGAVPSARPSTQTTATDSAGDQAERSPAPYSAGIQEIVNLADAGVSGDVIKAFIERSAVKYDPTAADLIALKKRGVGDEVLTALLKRSASPKTRSRPAGGAVAAPAIVRDFSTGGRLDPESYEFWYYHYAYPRALASSYQTLSPYRRTYLYGAGRGFRSGPPHFSTGRLRSR